MARPTLDIDCKTFLGELRKVENPIGNGAFRRHLGWNETRYWKVHSSLAEEGRLVKGRGRGGSVSRA